MNFYYMFIIQGEIMSNIVEQLRHACALGSYESILAIEGAVPIVHSGPGCVSKIWSTLGIQNGCQGTGHIGGHSIPCTDAGEKEVIFGGTDRLEKVISNSFKVMDADLYVVLTGCTSDIVGDYVGEVVDRFKAQGKPIVYAETGGFKGSNFIGHELVIDAIIDQYLKPSDKIDEGLVNIWATVPYQDTFWSGNLETIEKLLNSIGVRTNIIFGHGRGINALNKVPKAQYNLLISPWIGLKNVKHLKEKFGTEFLQYPVLPIGPKETGKFLRTIGEFLGIDKSIIEREIEKQEDRYFYYLERAADVLLETRLLPKHFVTIADSTYALAISKFLINDLGLLPARQFITEDVSKQYEKKVKESFSGFYNNIVPEIQFTSDSGDINSYLKDTDFRTKPLILGSGWDRVISKDIKGYELSISAPVSDRMVLDRSYLGYDGGMRLIEDIYTVVLQDFQ